MTDDEAVAYDSGIIDGRLAERERIIEQIERQLCFDSLANPEGRCSFHSGKCYELRQLINKLKGNNA